MGYNIFSKEGSLGHNLNIMGWQSLMSLACILGWKPQGTVLMSWKDNQTGEMFPPVCFDDKTCKDGQWEKDDRWTGSYSSNDHQEITAADAKNLAEALQKAFEHISGNRNSETEAIKELDEDGWDENSLVDRKNLIDACSESDAQGIIKDFIELFNTGACYIV